MHQKLKFNVSVKKLNEWQPIIATEYIGTFYMVYIKLCENIQGKDQNTSVKCKFYIQNYRGSIKMGLGDVNNIVLKPENRKKEGFDYTLEIPVIPFHHCNETEEEKNLVFPLGIKPGNTIFETEIIHQELPKSIFNTDNLQNSKFIHPLYCFREGDNMNHIYYKKNISERNNEGKNVQSSEITGGFYDKKPLNNTQTSTEITVKQKDTRNFNETEIGFGAKHSPTCDAKRTDIIW
ncbi:MAG: hypothetical protein AB8B78_07755 [Polaribacter sp.]